MAKKVVEYCCKIHKDHQQHLLFFFFNFTLYYYAEKKKKWQPGYK